MHAPSPVSLTWITRAQPNRRSRSHTCCTHPPYPAWTRHRASTFRKATIGRLMTNSGGCQGLAKQAARHTPTAIHSQATLARGLRRTRPLCVQNVFGAGEQPFPLGLLGSYCEFAFWRHSVLARSSGCEGCIFAYLLSGSSSLFGDMSLVQMRWRVGNERVNSTRAAASEELDTSMSILNVDCDGSTRWRTCKYCLCSAGIKKKHTANISDSISVMALNRKVAAARPHGNLQTATMQCNA